MTFSDKHLSGQVCIRTRHHDLEVPLVPSRLAENVIAAYTAAVGPIEDMGYDNIILKMLVTS